MMNPFMTEEEKRRKMMMQGDVAQSSVPGTAGPMSAATTMGNAGPMSSAGAMKAPQGMSLGSLLGAQGGGTGGNWRQYANAGAQAPGLGPLPGQQMAMQRTPDNPRRYQRLPGAQPYQNPYIAGLMQF